MSIGKAIAKNINKAGTAFTLIAYHDGSFGVMKLCTNYSGHVAGGISKTWRYCGDRRMTEVNATNLFNRRIKGKQK